MSCCVFECCDSSLFDTFSQKQPQELREEQSQPQTARLTTDDTTTDSSTIRKKEKTKSLDDSNTVVSSNTEATVSFDQDDSNTIAQTKEPSTSSSSSNIADECNDTCDPPLLDSSDANPLETCNSNLLPSPKNQNDSSQTRSRSFMVPNPITRSTSTAVKINRYNIDANNKASPMNIRSKSFAYQPNASPPHIDISEQRALAKNNRRAVAPAPPESSPPPTSTVTSTTTATTTSTTVKKDIVEPVKEDDFVEPVKAVLLEHRRRIHNTPPLPNKSPTPKVTNSKFRKTINTSSPADIESTSANSNNNITRSLKELASRFPDATPEEHYRFLTGKGGDVRKASKQLEAYLEWRKIHGVASNNTNNNTQTSIIPSSSSLDEWHSCASHTISDDENDWNTSALSAISSDPTYRSQPTSTYPKLPRLARFDDSDGNDAMMGRDKNRILQLTPARLDSLVAEETYALCIALYLDRCLDRSSTEKITICIDVRSGHGWPNPPVRSIVPFIKAVVGVLETNFPERLGRSIVYPLPWTATAVWKVAKLFLDPNTARKMVVIKGPAEKDSKAPVEKLEQYIERDVLERMERNRVSTFVKRRRMSLGF